MNRLLLSCLLLILSACSTTTRDNPNASYFGVSALVSTLSPRVSDVNQNSKRVRTTSSGYQVGGGFPLYENLYAVAKISDLGRAKTSEGELSYSSADVGLSYRQPINDKTAAYAQILHGHLGVQSDTVDFVNLNAQHQAYSLGAEYAFDPRWVLKVELDSYDADIQALSLGVARRVTASEGVAVAKVLAEQEQRYAAGGRSLQVLNSDYIRFLPSSDTFAPWGEEMLAKALVANKAMGTKILIRGFTDLASDNDPEQRLAKQRAAAVAALFGRDDPTRMVKIVVASGLKNPTADPDIAAFNRRVEVFWY